MKSEARFDLRPMMKPKSVALIGASRDPDKVGHVILNNYIDAGYTGKLYPVNKNADVVMGLKAYRSVLDIKKPIDLAVIAIPAEAVPQAMEECGKAGAKTCIVVSGGFAEVGNEELQNKMVEVANRYKMPTVGPNCLGVMDSRSRSDTLFLPTFKLSKPKIGGVSFVAQSGAVGSTVLDLIAKEGFGLSKFISYGNAAQVDEVDILNYLMHDDETKVIVMYIEGVKRGREFAELAKRITKVKPVVIIKGGITEAGSAAAHSHTAALAGSYEAYEAVFRQAGFAIAKDLSELLYFAKAFVSEPLPKGDRVAIITNGGGLGVLAVDEVYLSGLRLGEFSKETIDGLRKVMPPIVNVRNPLDMAGDADEKRYENAVSIVSKDPNIDMLIVVTLFQTPGADSTVAAKLIHFKESMDKPMIDISVGSDYTEAQKLMMESSGLPVYDSPTAATRALAELLKYAKYKDKVI